MNRLYYTKSRKQTFVERVLFLSVVFFIVGVLAGMCLSGALHKCEVNAVETPIEEVTLIDEEPPIEETKPAEKTPIVKKTTEVKNEEQQVGVVTEQIETADGEFVSLGMFTATAYCPCYDCSEGWGRSTSTGAIATAGRTIAVDPTVIPYGTHVWINGHEYIAEDCGGAIKGKKVDIFFDTDAEASQWGRRTVEVFVRG